VLATVLGMQKTFDKHGLRVKRVISITVDPVIKSVTATRSVCSGPTKLRVVAAHGGLKDLSKDCPSSGNSRTVLRVLGHIWKDVGYLGLLQVQLSIYGHRNMQDV
jgi:hypothetical protein